MLIWLSSSAFVITLFSGLLLSTPVFAAHLVAIPVSAPNAVEYLQTSNGYWSLNQLCGLAVPLILLLSGQSARIYGACLRVAGQRKIVGLSLFAALFFLLDRLLRVPVSYCWERAYENAVGEPAQAFAPWLLSHMSEGLVLVVGLTVVTLCVNGLMRKSPARWWLWATGIVSLLVLAVLLLEPFTQNTKPLGTSRLEQRVADLAAQVGIPRRAIVTQHCEPASACPPGRVIGLGPTRMMILNEMRLTQNPEAWTLQMVAHESKHFALDDNIKAFYLLSGLSLCALLLVKMSGEFIVARWSRRVGFSTLAHPASLPLVVLILNGFYLVALPPVNAFRQQVELEADRFALELNRDNEAQSQMIASWVDQKSNVSEWNMFFKLFRASHPSVATRITLSNTYRPWQAGKPLVYERDFQRLKQKNIADGL